LLTATAEPVTFVNTTAMADDLRTLGIFLTAVADLHNAQNVVSLRRRRIT
jgi:hypothetical protein